MSSPMEMTDRYDHALLGILQHVGNIGDFLQVYFGFLYRKTDFYRHLSPPNEKLGFPPGVAEKMVFKTYKLFERVADNDRERQKSQQQRRAESRPVPAAIQELEIATEQLCEETVETVTVETEHTESSIATDDGQDVTSEAGAGPKDKLTPKQDEAAAARPNPAEGPQDRHQLDPDTYNGSVTERYSWSQDYTDLEIRVFVPNTVLKGKQVSVSLQCGSMKVCVREGAEEKVLMEGEFTHKINTENSLWSLEPGSCVVLSLSKSSEVWWSAVLKGEKEIDINQINRERSMATVDEEEHAVLDRLTFDYHQKLAGKPQSHEMKVHDMLKKGWDAEGSPFRGQQFDPAQFDIPASAVQF